MHVGMWNSVHVCVHVRTVCCLCMECVIALYTNDVCVVVACGRVGKGLGMYECTCVCVCLFVCACKGVRKCAQVCIPMRLACQFELYTPMSV